MRANLRAVQTALHRVRQPLIALLLVVCIGTAVFWASGEFDTPIRAFLFVLNLISLQASPGDLPSSAWLQLAALGVTAGGVAAIASGATRVIELATDPQSRQQALASTLSHHIVVCGIGRVGYRVITELIELGESVVAVNATQDEEMLALLRGLNVPLIIGDARRSQTLIYAGVQRAAAIVVCTSDELTNLDIALDARELNPNIKVVLRMFDDKLAERVSRGFHIRTAFSTSALAAPVFAVAAMRTSVDYSFKVEGRLFNVLTFTFQASSPFVGMPIAQLEAELQCTVLGRWEEAGFRANPPAEHLIRAGERYTVVGSLDALRVLRGGT